MQAMYGVLGEIRKYNMIFLEGWRLQNNALHNPMFLTQLLIAFILILELICGGLLIKETFQNVQDTNYHGHQLKISSSLFNFPVIPFLIRRWVFGASDF
jgi:Ni,Fe-hydrogenase I cytochrome b subunit